MNNKNPSEILDAIKTSIDYKGIKNNINLHEPSFIDTRAFEYLKDCINTGWVSSSGHWVNKFEEEICKFTGSNHAVAVTNGTVALRLALHCVGVEFNNEVIMPPFTFVATANAISHLGAYPHFVDISSKNLSLAPELVRKRLEEIAIRKHGKVFNKITGRRIAAILPVHVFGMPAELFKIKEVAEDWGLPIVEDAAEALGSRHYVDKNRFVHCGLIGDLGVISFNGNKLITTGGGGIIITNNKKLAMKCKHLSTTAKKNHPWEFDHDEIGWNDRMPNINAALGVAQLEVIENKLLRKNILLNKYKDSFSLFDNVEILEDYSKNIANNWLINIRYLDHDIKRAKKIRDELLQRAFSENIFMRPAWRLIHKLKMYKNNPKTNLKVAEDQEFRIVSLPSSPQLVSRELI